MADLKFKVDAERLTLDDLVDIETKGTSPLFLRGFMSRFLVNGTGEIMDHGEAEKALGKLNILELNDVSEKFMAAIDQLKEQILPKASD